MKTIIRCSLIIAFTWINVPVYAGDLQDGVEAYKEEDFETVVSKWQPLAERGDPRAQFNLGMMYFDGYGEANNYFAAAKWFWRASKQGHAKSQLKLGTMYYKGIGVTESKSKAAKLYRMSAAGGNGKAQTLAGLVYGEGLGVDQDFKEAAKWYQLAAEKGYATAQYNLGVMYRYGNGVDMDIVKAYTWFLIAGENDNDGANNDKDDLAENMDQVQISEGKKLAAKWIEKHPKKE